MSVNSKNKGATYEREIRNDWRKAGFSDARRSAQYCGNSGDAADVVGIPYLHIECKRQEVYKIDDWVAQAEFDSRFSKDAPVLIFRKAYQPSYALMRLNGGYTAKGEKKDGFIDIYRYYYEGKKEEEDMKIILEEGAIKPKRAHILDAGFDLYSPIETIVPAKDSIKIDTGVHIQIPMGYCGLIVAKSGLMTKHGITATGLIDAGYNGTIVAALFNHSDEDYHIHAGDKITQIIITDVYTDELEVVDSFEETERGNNGFGSTGK